MIFSKIIHGLQKKVEKFHFSYCIFRKAML